MNPYIPVLLILVFGIVLGGIMSAMAAWLGPRHPTPLKMQVFECGVPPSSAHQKMSVKFYLTGLLFILFDIETVFLYLWAKVFKDLGLWGIVEMAVFMTVLIVGYVYVLRRGALEWE